MKSEEKILNQILSQGVLPLYFHSDKTVSIEVMKVLYQSGIRAIEYTNRGKQALENFKEMQQICHTELEGMYIGIGTIKNKKDAENFISSGADFIVSPGVVSEVIETAGHHNLLCIPGCMTPSEIISVENMGIRLVKLFPGSLLGPGYMSSIKSLFPDMMFMPTGGVSLDRENISAWFKAGVSAVGMGSKLISRQLLEQKNYAEIGELTKKAIQIVKEVRK